MITIPIQRTGKSPAQGVVIVDDDIADLLARRNWRLHLTHKGYAVVRLPLHHLVYGVPTEGKVIDHINGNRLDNRRANLREATTYQNMQGCRHTRKRNATGLRGVFSMKNGRFGARGRVNGHLVHVRGSFSTAREAHAAYLRAVLDRQSQLPDSGDDLDFSVLKEFAPRQPARQKMHLDMPRGVFKCRESVYRAVIRREKQSVYLGTRYKTADEAHAVVLAAERAYATGGMLALRTLAKTKRIR